MKAPAPNRWICFAIWALAWMEPLAAATVIAAEDDGPMVSDDISENLSRTENEEAVGGLVRYFREARRHLREKAALDTSLSYHTLGMAAVGGGGVPTAMSGDLTLQGVWKPGARWHDNAMELHFRLRERHAIGDTAASALGIEIGTLWGLTDGFSDGGFEIPDLYLEHNFERFGVRMRYGQMTVDSQFDKHHLRSSKMAFLNQAFSSNPAVAFPRSGAGISLVKEFKNGVQLAIAVTNVQGSTAGDQVDYKANSDNLFEVVQLSREFEFWGERKSRVQLLGWRSDGAEEVGSSEGNGISLTVEQEISDDMRAFGRVAWAEGEATPVDRLVMGGVGFSCGDDGLLGLGAGIGHGSGQGGGTQGVLEGFFRWQPRPGLRITPDVQLVVGNGFNSSPGVRFVFGLRAGLEF